MRRCCATGGLKHPPGLRHSSSTLSSPTDTNNDVVRANPSHPPHPGSPEAVRAPWPGHPQGGPPVATAVARRRPGRQPPLARRGAGAAQAVPSQERAAARRVAPARGHVSTLSAASAESASGSRRPVGAARPGASERGGGSPPPSWGLQARPQPVARAAGPSASRAHRRPPPPASRGRSGGSASLGVLGPTRGAHRRAQRDGGPPAPPNWRVPPPPRGPGPRATRPRRVRRSWGRARPRFPAGPAPRGPGRHAALLRPWLVGLEEGGVALG